MGVEEILAAIGIVSVCAGLVVTLAKVGEIAAAAWRRVRKPHTDLVEASAEEDRRLHVRIDDHQEECRKTREEYEKRFKNDNDLLNWIVPTLGLLLKTNMCLLEHAIYGNHTEQMIQTLEKTKDHLINR